MIVFKSYLKTAMNYKNIIIINLLVFGAISFFMTGTSNDTSDFKSSEASIIIINNDKDGEISSALETYAKKTFDVVKEKKTVDEAKDMIFYSLVQYTVIIPEGYSDAFFSDNPLKLETLTIPNSQGSQLVEMQLDKFLNLTRVYKSRNVDTDTMVKMIMKDINQKGEVNLFSNNSNQVSKLALFFNMGNYIFLALVVAGICIVSTSFKDPHVKKRNIVSAMPYKVFNSYLSIANFLYCLFVWLAYLVLAAILYPDAIFTNHALLLVVNSFLFIFVCFKIATLVTNLIKSREAQGAIQNILALGTSFISGAFVPQAYLSSFVLTISMITPSYWFVKNNNLISELANINSKTLQPIILNWIVLVVFIVVIHLVINFVSKKSLRK